MKKYIFTILLAASLAACNNKPAGQDVAGSLEHTVAQDTATTSQTEATTQSPEATAELQNTGTAEYTPTGDIERDAQALVDKQLEMVTLENHGEQSEALKQEITTMLMKLGEYYTRNNRQDEFQKVLGEKLKDGIRKLKTEQLGS